MRPSLSRSFVVALLAAAGGPACDYQPDVDALTQKYREECRISPPMPDCARDHEEAERVFWQDHFDRHVHSAEEEACILEAPCDCEDPSVFLRAVADCSKPTVEEVVITATSPRPDDGCTVRCAGGLAVCGGETCDESEAEFCLAEHHRCLGLCPAS